MPQHNQAPFNPVAWLSAWTSRGGDVAFYGEGWFMAGRSIAIGTPTNDELDTLFATVEGNPHAIAAIKTVVRANPELGRPTDSLVAA